MRWHPNPTSSRAEVPWWGWLLSPIWAPPFALVLAVAGTLVGILWCKRWLMGPTEQWRPWFAWYPVAVPAPDLWPDEERVWLEWIERRAAHLMGDAEHRLPQDNSPYDTAKENAAS